MAIEKTRIAAPQKILVIKFSSIGDIVLTTSPIKSIKKIFPSSRIDILTRLDFAPLLEGFKYINKIISFDRNADIWQLIKTGIWLNNAGYDLVIDFHNSLRSKIIRLCINNVSKAKLKKPRWHRFLLFRFRKNKFSRDFNQLRLLHNPLNKWKFDSELPLPELYVSNMEKAEGLDYLKKKGIKKEYITIIPGAAWPQKTWLAEKYNELIKNIKKLQNYDFVILGGKSDIICSDLTKFDKSYLNLQGNTNLRESMAIIANSKFVIGADTGFVHVAEALGKNAVMILGPTSRETGAGTNRKTSIAIQNNDIWCRPCSQNGKRKCYRNEQYCMTTITSNYILSQMKELLN